MASVVIAIGVAVYFTTEKVREHKEKKRALKLQQASEHGPIEEITTGDLHDDEHLPGYQKEVLPGYHMEDQHPALRNEKRQHRFHM